MTEEQEPMDDIQIVDFEAAKPKKKKKGKKTSKTGTIILSINYAYR